jgi:hypothetical protein
VCLTGVRGIPHKCALVRINVCVCVCVCVHAREFACMKKRCGAPYTAKDSVPIYPFFHNTSQDQRENMFMRSEAPTA